MALAVHEEHKNFIASGLAAANYWIDHLGGTFHAADTNFAQFKQTNLSGFNALHEDFKNGAVPNNRLFDTLNSIGIFTDTEVAASNDTATSRAQFTAQDPTLPADLHGARSRP